MILVRQIHGPMREALEDQLKRARLGASCEPLLKILFRGGATRRASSFGLDSFRHLSPRVPESAVIGDNPRASAGIRDDLDEAAPTQTSR
jgi:hypothetical protein